MPQELITLFHYADSKAYEEIRRRSTLPQSGPWTAADAQNGTGFYLTDLPPETEDLVIATFCWQSMDPKILRRLDCYLEFKVEARYAARIREHVFFVEPENEGRIYHHGRSGFRHGRRQPVVLGRGAETDTGERDQHERDTRKLRPWKKC